MMACITFVSSLAASVDVMITSLVSKYVRDCIAPGTECEVRARDLEGRVGLAGVSKGGVLF
jgi:hypothetical protein